MAFNIIWLLAVGAELNNLLNNKAINAWRLFWLIIGPISIAVIVAMLRTDLSTGEGVSFMVQLSVRCAVPLLFVAFAASSTAALFPGTLSSWLLRNRKFIGLSFAAAMAWQALFIIWLVTVHRDYYVAEVYVLRDVIEGVLGYSFLIAMTLTSFRFGRKHLTPKQWKLLHTLGIYSLWIYAFSVYWWNLYYYSNPLLIDYIYYWAAFLAWALRTTAWRKKRLQSAEGGQPVATRLIGTAIMLAGLIVVAFGTPWREMSGEFMSGFAFSNWLLLYLPYWPFEPYIPLFVILLGISITTGRAQQKPG